jgi:hypothetical protein
MQRLAFSHMLWRFQSALYSHEFPPGYRYELRTFQLAVEFFFMVILIWLFCNDGNGFVEVPVLFSGQSDFRFCNIGNMVLT